MKVFEVKMGDEYLDLIFRNKFKLSIPIEDISFLHLIGNRIAEWTAAAEEKDWAVEMFISSILVTDPINHTQKRLFCYITDNPNLC